MKSVLNIKDFEKCCRSATLCNKFQLFLVLYTHLKQLLGIKGHQQKKLLLVIFVMFASVFYV